MLATRSTSLTTHSSTSAADLKVVEARCALLETYLALDANKVWLWDGLTSAVRSGPNEVTASLVTPAQKPQHH
jgi:hypothetical protein